jgi:hypothetical protein
MDVMRSIPLPPASPTLIGWEIIAGTVAARDASRNGKRFREIGLFAWIRPTARTVNDHCAEQPNHAWGHAFPVEHCQQTQSHLPVQFVQIYIGRR